ncbi:ABC transporter ATP-binding protein [Paenibacillus oryzae]|uniref:ABC transporter ATP-binding protein n=2 Tax=Paenibacillus oryzae TaxID=1844972 RepID=A0A1A5YFW8_9BACL|nr:ABC transporter ATP-binding protein [Paenibacillus oryzae]OBR64474.1 ABC transporter ATP-binding protein [Paenibacillus oryzae]
MFSYLSKYRAAAFVAILLMFFELIVELLQPYLIAKIIDEGIVPNRSDVVMFWGGLMLACSLIAFVIGILSSFYAAHVSQSFGFDLRQSLYSKVQDFTFPQFGRFQVSSLITRLTNDVQQLQNTVFMGLRVMLRAPLFVFGSVIMSLLVNPSVALWFIIGLPFLCLFLAWVLKRGESLFSAVQSRLDKVNGVIQQNLIGMRLIRVFVRMRHEGAKFDQASGELTNRTIVALRFTELTMPIILLVMNTCIILVLWFGKIGVDAGAASMGEIVAIVNYATRTTGALSLMSMIVVAFSRGRASAQRISEVELAANDTEQDASKAADHSSDEAASNAAKASGDISANSQNREARANNENDYGTTRPLKGAVEFRQVGFRYPDSDVNVLSDISFSARAGETLAIMGSTGSGKTSLLGLIPRLYEADEGAVLVDGIDNRKMELETLRRQIGYVPQEIMLFSGTVAENISWGKRDASLDEIKDAAKRAQIHETIMKLPLQYDTVIGQKGVNLSGGQKQRLSIARALVRKPAILLLDDCTSALDVRTESALLAELKDLSCTILLVTQKISSTANADTILLMDDGRLLASGSHHELMQNSLLYQRIYESQYGKAGVGNA